MFQTLFGVNMSIFKGAMAPGSEVTSFWHVYTIFTCAYDIAPLKIDILTPNKV